MKKEFVKVPVPTLKRLPRYLQVLHRYKKNDIKSISAATIAKELNLEAIVVRKDIQVTGITGRPKIGFDLDDLITTLTKFLNWDNNTDAFLVGAGGLGQAILGYGNFTNHGINIIAAFDDSPLKVGETIHGIEILPIEKLANLVKRMKINIGIITVPAETAQSVADLLVEAGVTGIWNFAPVQLNLPSEIILENVHLSQSLAILTHRLQEK